MYYLLNYSIQDEKKDMWLDGTLYNQNQDIVKNIFDKGHFLEKTQILAPFTIILDEKESSIKNKKLQDKISTSVIESGFLFLISSAAQTFFKKLPIDNLQYFEVAIKSSYLNIDNYKIVNITDKIDCTDFSASVLDQYRNGDIDMISKLVLDETKIPKGKQLFLLGRSASGIIIVHEDFKKSIEDSELTGFHFVELDNASTLY